MAKVYQRRTAAVAERMGEDSVRALQKVSLKRPIADFAGSYQHEWYGKISIDVKGDSVFYQWGAIAGPAQVVDSRTCGFFGCKYYNSLIIEAGDNEMGIDFEFPEKGPAVAIKLRNERFARR
jgi:hypothetical protein